MTKFGGNDHQAEIRRKLGIAFRVLAAIGLLWIGNTIDQLWNAPRTVPFVVMFIELVDISDDAPLISNNGKEVNLPKSWPIAAGIFLSIVLISSAGSIVHTLISAAISLLFPELKTKKRLESKSDENQQ